MQKKILALAVAAAFSAPAFADNANVTVYGKVFADVESVSSNNVGTNAGAKVSNTLQRVTSNASRLGFKGSEDLGDGLKANYQLEAEFQMDGNGANGPFSGTRNSKIGLEGGFGEVFIGNWDTPYKLAHNTIELYDNTTFGSAINVMGRFSGTAATSMNTRLKDSVNYFSPSFAGFQVKLAYGMDDAKTAATTAPVAAGTNQKVTALSAGYDHEMFNVTVATQRHSDTNGLTNAAALGAKLTGNRLVGAFKFGTAGFVGLTYETMKATIAGVESKRNAFEVAGKYAFGAHSAGLSYAKAGNVTTAGLTTADSGATQISARYGYAFSKRTELYAMYTSLKNGVAANYNFNGGTNSAIANSQAGASLSGLGVGMIMNF